MKRAIIVGLGALCVFLAAPAWGDMVQVSFQDHSTYPNAPYGNPGIDYLSDSWSIAYLGAGSFAVESVSITLAPHDGQLVKFDLAGGVTVKDVGFDFAEVSTTGKAYSYSVTDGGTTLAIDFTADNFSSGDLLAFTIDIDNGNAVLRGENMAYSSIVVTYSGGKTATASFVKTGEFAAAASATLVPAPGAALLALIGLPIIGWIKRRFA